MQKMAFQRIRKHGNTAHQKSVSIRKKVTKIIVSTVIVSSIFIYLFNAILVAKTGIQEAKDSLQLLTDVTSQNLEATLLFRDKQGSQEIVQSLKLANIVTKAIVVSPENIMIASFHRPSSQDRLSAVVKALPVPLEISANRKIYLEGELLGEIQLQGDLGGMWELMLSQLLQLALIIICLLICSLYLSNILAPQIIRPMHHIATIARSITEGRNYKVRIPDLGIEEVSELATEFNNMLAEIDRRETKLQEQHERMDFALHGSNDGLWDWVVDTDCLFLSPRWKGMLGYADEEIENRFSSWYALVDPDSRDATFKKIDSLICETTAPFEIEFRMRHKNGTWVDILARAKLATDTEGNQLFPRRLVGTTTNISHRKQSDHELRIAATAFESQDGMIITDAAYKALRTNIAFSAITGYTVKDAIGLNPLDLLLAADTPIPADRIWNSVSKHGIWRGEARSVHKDGHTLPTLISITAVEEKIGTVQNYVVTINDISESIAATAEINQLAFFDSLTQLPNRRLLLDRLQQALATISRTRLPGAIMFIDLDNFKSLNDTLGHDVGDVLLKQVAGRVTSCVRDCDTVARLGGDEFVVLIESLPNRTHAAASQAHLIAEKIRQELNKPFLLDKYEHKTSPSIGIALFASDAPSSEQIMKQADIAMYQAKKSGRNTIRIFDPDMQKAIDTHATIVRGMQNALQKHEFTLFYQKQVDHLGNLTGAELLLRWISQEHGSISPAVFIPIAEETGMIIEIGMWVIESACKQISLWQSADVQCIPQLSVNVSPRQFYHPGFCGQVIDAVRKYRINPCHLKLELTESMLLENTHETIQKMNILKNSGLQISMDDFGTGYSSLSNLTKLPIDQLKIDQSFVRELRSDEDSLIIIQTIIEMAQKLGITVIAEGVETIEQKNLLYSNGCTLYQGYLFGRPVPVTEFELDLEDKKTIIEIGRRKAALSHNI